jgi:hypothetical protein
MEAYCDEVRRLEDKFYGLELNHIALRYNETADELAKIASVQTTVPLDVFSRYLHQPSVKTDDTSEPEKVSALPEAPSAQPEAPSASEGEALHVEGERNGVPPNREPKLGDWHDAPSCSSCWGTRRSSTTAAPQTSSSDAYPSPKARSYYKKYTRGLAVTTQHLEPSLGMPSDKVSTGQPRWPLPLGLYAPAKGVNSTRSRPTYPLRLYRQYPSPGRLLCGVWTSSVPCRRHPGATRTCWSPSTNSPSGSRSDP